MKLRRAKKHGNVRTKRTGTQLENNFEKYIHSIGHLNGAGLGAAPSLGPQIASHGIYRPLTFKCAMPFSSKKADRSENYGPNEYPQIFSVFGLNHPNNNPTNCKQ